MSKHKNQEKSNAIKQYERRWIKPTLITLLIIGLPILFFSVRYGSNVVQAMTQHDASFSTALHAARRPDTDYYFESTPNVNRDNVITTAEELPDEPVLVVFYLHHCPYCEVAFQSIQHNKELLRDEYENIDDNLVYVEVTTPLGVELTREYGIEVSSTILLLAEHEEDNMIVGSSRNDSAGQPAKNTDNILQIFRAFDRELAKQVEYQNQRERNN